MAYPPNHTFSRPVELNKDELFSIDRRHNALVIDPHANNYVRQVDDSESPWTSVAELGAAITFGGAPGAVGVAVNSAAARSVLRPSSRGDGRGRWR